jgi:hypothetical protein
MGSYNIPYRKSVNLTTDTLLELARLPNIVSVKDSSGSLAQSLFPGAGGRARSRPAAIDSRARGGKERHAIGRPSRSAVRRRRTQTRIISLR